ncbi:hypothetical protein HPC49_26895 [Pyxidicoccus fallax]|uniref:Uncharacterized protein n=1 Tax=Pyxidicoccus fallax TaxID=394095 RepID=A0A848LA02_9BACT|nr:hypothetical protein [Pyxidicoccus fallax]NMO15880.1 hypothetical protein [Pyxidicoccus fallax]NPC81833.1 hypothetical protein [Pyxidicoccus fallax]
MPLVRARDVFGWCDRNLVDYQGEGVLHQALWDADLEEARGEHRLLKFKSGECKQSRVGWALLKNGTKARDEAARKGWHELRWNGEQWDWLRPPAAPSAAPAVPEAPVEHFAVASR